MRFFPLFLRRPDNLLSVPTLAQALPTQRPGFLQGDPSPWIPSTLALLHEQSGGMVLPWDADCDLLILPAPLFADELPVEILRQLPGDYPVLVYESHQPVFPNAVVAQREDCGEIPSSPFDAAAAGLRAFRSAFRHQGKGGSEAFMLLPASRLLYLSRLAFRFESKPSPGASLQNRRFLSLPLDYSRSVHALAAQVHSDIHTATARDAFCEPPALAAAQRVAVVIPHFDDESIACGGAIASAVESGAEVRLIWLTDGSRGVPSVSHQESARLRKEEALEAASRLGVTDVHFLDFPETRLTDKVDSRNWLGRLLDDFQPTRIHSLWWAENNVDHYQMNRLLRAAMPKSLRHCELAMGGVWSPLPVIPGVTQSLALKGGIAQKQVAALSAHTSQIKEVDYLRVSAGLNAWNGRFGQGPAENFLVMPAQDYWRAFDQSGSKRRIFLG